MKLHDNQQKSKPYYDQQIFPEAFSKPLKLDLPFAFKQEIQFEITGNFVLSFIPEDILDQTSLQPRLTPKSKIIKHNVTACTIIIVGDKTMYEATTTFQGQEMFKNGETNIKVIFITSENHKISQEKDELDIKVKISGKGATHRVGIIRHIEFEVAPDDEIWFDNQKESAKISCKYWEDSKTPIEELIITNDVLLSREHDRIYLVKKIQHHK